MFYVYNELWPFSEVKGQYCAHVTWQGNGAEQSAAATTRSYEWFTLKNMAEKRQKTYHFHIELTCLTVDMHFFFANAISSIQTLYFVIFYQYFYFYLSTFSSQ